MTSAKLKAKSHRWVAWSADFNFTIKYWPGKQLANGDGLSCMPLDFDEFTRQRKWATMLAVHPCSEWCCSPMTPHSGRGSDVAVQWPPYSGRWSDVAVQWPPTLDEGVMLQSNDPPTLDEGVMLQSNDPPLWTREWCCSPMTPHSGRTWVFLFAQAYATKDKWEVPEKIFHDMGRELENNLFAGLQKVWLSHHSEATGLSSYYLLFGHSPRLPNDLMFNMPGNEKQQSYVDYVADWWARMQEAYEITLKTTEKQEKATTGLWNWTWGWQQCPPPEPEGERRAGQAPIALGEHSVQSLK